MHSQRVVIHTQQGKPNYTGVLSHIRHGKQAVEEGPQANVLCWRETPNNRILSKALISDCFTLSCWKAGMVKTHMKMIASPNRPTISKWVGGVRKEGRKEKVCLRWLVSSRAQKIVRESQPAEPELESRKDEGHRGNVTGRFWY